MKLFVLLILVICLVIDYDSFILAKTNTTKNVIPTKKLNNKPILYSIPETLEKILKIGVKKLNKPLKEKGILKGTYYETQKKELLIIKENRNKEFDKQFPGEFESLKAIEATKTLMVPHPIAASNAINKINFIALKYLKVNKFEVSSSAKLGSRLADLHRFNWRRKIPKVNKYGFNVDTIATDLYQNNTWTKDWITFFIENRLASQIEDLTKSDFYVKDNILYYYWTMLKPKIPDFFKEIKMKPSLLHGNLRSENVGQIGAKPVTINPASFYGHHEYDIATAVLYGNFSEDFYDAYYEKIPKQVGYLQRQKLYHLLHYLNNWRFNIIDEANMIDTIHYLVDWTL